MLETDIHIEDYSESLIRLSATLGLILVLIIVSRKQGLNIHRELSFSALRGFIQVMLMASIILIIFELDNLLVNTLALMGMVGVAAYVSSKRSEGLPDNLTISLWSILLGTSVILAVMAAVGALPLDAPYLIPLGGMIIGNSMNVTSLALDRLKGEVKSSRMRIDAYLALGATPEYSIRESVHRSVRSSLIPNIDGLSTLGVIWIPGLMAGMLIAGTDPYVAAILQLTIIIMILGACMISSLTCTYLMSKRLFSNAFQLIPLD